MICTLAGPHRISDWFTGDFRLHEPGKPALPVGHEGARQMPAAGRGEKLKKPMNVEALDMIEEGDRVAVRWQLTGTYDNGKPYEQSIMSIYRFENGRTGEDWGMAIPTVWPPSSSEQAHRPKLDVVSSTNAPNPVGVG